MITKKKVWVVIGDTGGGADDYMENTTIVGVFSAADLFCEVVQNFGDVCDHESPAYLYKTAELLGYYICEDELEAMMRQRWFENQIEDLNQPHALETDETETEWLTFNQMADFFEREGAEDREEQDRFNLWYEAQKATLPWPEQQALDKQLRAVLSYLEWEESNGEVRFYDHLCERGFIEGEKDEFDEEIRTSLRRLIGKKNGDGDNDNS